MIGPTLLPGYRTGGRAAGLPATRLSRTAMHAGRSGEADVAAALAALGLTRAEWDALSDTDRWSRVKAYLVAQGQTTRDIDAWRASVPAGALLVAFAARLAALAPAASPGDDGHAGGGDGGGGATDPQITAALAALDMTRAQWDAASSTERRGKLAGYLVGRGLSVGDASSWMASVSDDELLATFAAMLATLPPATGGGGDAGGAGGGAATGATDAQIAAALAALGQTQAGWDALSPADRRTKVKAYLLGRGQGADAVVAWLAGVSDADLLARFAARLATLGPGAGAGGDGPSGGDGHDGPSMRPTTRKKVGAGVALGIAALVLLVAK